MIGIQPEKEEVISLVQWQHRPPRDFGSRLNTKELDMQLILPNVDATHSCVLPCSGCSC